MWKTTNEVSNQDEFIDFLSEETEVVITPSEGQVVTITSTAVNLQEVLNHYIGNNNIAYYIERKADKRMLGSKNCGEYVIFLYWETDEDFISTFPEYLIGRYYLHFDGNVFVAEDIDELRTLLKEKGKEGSQLWKQGFLLGTKVKK